MADDKPDAPKKKTVSELSLDEIEGTSKPTAADDEDDGWGDPADIPDKPRSAQDLEAVYDIPVRVSAVLGKSSMQVNELLKLGRGAVVELDRKVGEAIDIYVNDRLVARGEVVVVDDRLGITMTEIIKTQKS
jgi:flagellar motor switch protein FliN/FliY